MKEGILSLCNVMANDIEINIFNHMLKNDILRNYSKSIGFPDSGNPIFLE